VLFLVLAFALATRSRLVAAGAALGAAILLKQFALVAIPFLVVMLLVRHANRSAILRFGGAALAVVVAGALPFVIADAGALWRDTISYGASTYRIVGYGLSGLLVKAGVVERTGSYPFVLLALVVWLPITIWLLREQLRARALWLGAVGFAVSTFTLFFVSRVFQTSYLIWPLTAIAMAVVLWSGESRSER
jgi:uncharacterized membrane protein